MVKIWLFHAKKEGCKAVGVALHHYVLNTQLTLASASVLEESSRDFFARLGRDQLIWSVLHKQLGQECRLREAAWTRCRIRIISLASCLDSVLKLEQRHMLKK